VTAAPHAAASAPARTAPAGPQPLVAPPPDAAPYAGHDDPPVSVGAGPQVSSGGTAAPDDTAVADKTPAPAAALDEAPQSAGLPVAATPGPVTPAPSPAAVPATGASAPAPVTP